MATLRQIRRRIKSVQSIERVTRAMRMVATARLRGAQASLVAARPYASELQRIISRISQGLDDYDHPLLRRREPQNSLLIVVSADRGLCGAFNANVLRLARNRLAELPGDTSVICVGKRADAVMRREGRNVTASYRDAFRHLNVATALSLARDVAQKYADAEVDRVEIVYNQFRSLLHQVPRLDTLLPVPLDAAAEDQGPAWDVIFEPSPHAILDTLMPKQLATQTWRILLESNASEQAARMNAMDNATKNADEMIDNLTLERNRVRQTMITKEIAEIVGGAEALKSS